MRPAAAAVCPNQHMPVRALQHGSAIKALDRHALAGQQSCPREGTSRPSTDANRGDLTKYELCETAELWRNRRVTDNQTKKYAQANRQAI